MIRVFFLLLLFQQVQAQVTEEDAGSQNVLESLHEKSDREESSAELNIETIVDKIRINQCTASELESLMVLSPYQVNQFLLYRKRLGVLVSIYELQAVPGWDLPTIRKISDLVSLEVRGGVVDEVKDRLKNGQTLFFLRSSRALEKSAGFLKDSSGFMGGRNSFQFRYSFNHKNLLQWGIAGGNQAGEPLSFEHGRPGFDQISLHLFARQLGKIKLLALGDFRVNFGQGLICWQGIGLAKSAEVMAIKREAPVLQPSATGASSGFYRGAGISSVIGGIDFALFLAINNKDANIEFDTVRSLSTGGLRRTASELKRRNNLSVMTVGSRVGMIKRNYSIHVNAMASYWDHPFIRHPSPNTLTAPVGSRFVNISADHSVTIRNINWFGEVAINERHSMALLTGAMVSLDKRANFSLLYRNISPRYYSFDGNAFMDGSYTTNEHGIYVSIQLPLSKKIEISLFHDIYSFPWLKSKADFPSAGHSFFAQFRYTPDKATEFYVRFRSELNQKSVNVWNVSTRQIISTAQRNFRINYVSSVGENLNMHLRLEQTWFAPNSTGLLVFTELQKRSRALQGRITARIQYTDTDNYDTRIYAYESDVPYSYSITAQYGRFIKYYFIGTFNIRKIKKSLAPLTVSCKFSQRFLIDSESVGSGVNLIQNRIVSTCALQLAYRTND